MVGRARQLWATLATGHMTCTCGPFNPGAVCRQRQVHGDTQGRSGYADARMGQGMAAGGYALVGGYAMPARGVAQLPPGGPGSCHVGNMPPDADKLYLYERFAPHGAIVSVKVTIRAGQTVSGDAM